MRQLRRNSIADSPNALTAPRDCAGNLFPTAPRRGMVSASVSLRGSGSSWESWLERKSASDRCGGTQPLPKDVGMLRGPRRKTRQHRGKGSRFNLDAPRPAQPIVRKGGPPPSCVYGAARPHPEDPGTERGRAVPCPLVVAPSGADYAPGALSRLGALTKSSGTWHRTHGAANATRAAQHAGTQRFTRNGREFR